MKHGIQSTLCACAVFASAGTGLHAAYTEAKFTRIEKEVKVLKENAAAHTANVGEKVNAVTSIATGVSSRAELQFPDKTLTRIGANSRFTIRGEAHTLDLDKGVIYMEVPEKVRSAKVRTAAVTAAITGGSGFLEYLPNGYVKFICVEGEMDIVSNSNPANFTTLHPGQMVIMKWDSKTIPQPVDIDLKRLLETSKLNKFGNENSPNTSLINSAINGQQDQINSGSLQETNLFIPGLGTLVSLSGDKRFDVFNNFQIKDKPNNNPNGGNGGGTGTTVIPPPQTTPPFQGFVPLIKDTSVINNNTTIKTDPEIKAFNSGTGNILTSNGLAYNGLRDGTFPYFAFGSTGITDPELQPKINAAGDWAVYKFQQLLINGSPWFVHNYYLSEGFVSGPTPLTAPIGINNVILAAIGDVKLDHDNSLATGEGSPALSTENSLDISSTFLNDLLIYSQNGSVTLGQDFGISADGQNVSIATAGTNSDITIAGFIDIYGGSLLLSAGRDVYINGDRVGADVISIRAGRDVTVDGAVPYSEGYGTVQANTGNLTISAKRHIHITNSAQLFALSQLPSDALLRLESTGGDITVDNRSRIEGTNVEIEAFTGNVSILDSTITATHALKARTLLPNGTLLISNSTLTAGQTSNIGDLIRLYADGSNGKVLFQGNVTLNSDEVQIAGKTVQVDPGGTVTVSKNNAHIFADQHNYNVGPGYGVIVSGSLSAYGFSDSRKPDFKTGGKLGRAGP